jgi:DNA-binding response OmpR family regulator
MKVILVDDEQKFVNMLAKRLAFRGIYAEAVFSGDDAIQKILDKDYDVAILDIKMPGISGLELKRELSSLAPKLKFIFVTGHGAGSNSKNGSITEDIYLSKPLDIDNLITILNKVTKNRE